MSMKEAVHCVHNTDDAALRACCEDYWALTSTGTFRLTVKEILETYPALNISTSRLGAMVAEWCSAQSTRIRCSSCHTPYVFKNRTDLTSKMSSSAAAWQCDPCTERIRTQKRQAQEQRNRFLQQRIRAYFTYDSVMPRFCETFSLTEAVYYVSAIRLLADESLVCLSPTASRRQTLTPLPESTTELLSTLHDQRILLVDPDASSLHAFVLNDADELVGFYPRLVAWVANVMPSERLLPPSYDVELRFQSGDWLEHWAEDEWRLLGLRIARDECLQYLLWALQKHRFDFHPGEKTLAVIAEGLQSWSVAQMYNLIWRAANDAAAYYQRERVSRPQAANSAITRLQRSMERARDEGWDIKPFGRSRDCPRSVLSEVLFSSVLQSSDEGFTAPVSQWERRLHVPVAPSS